MSAHGRPLLLEFPLQEDSVSKNLPEPPEKARFL